MRKGKKGAIELSVGAVVVLILAITFLSLGLLFIRGVLGKMFSKFDEQVSQEPEPPAPSLSNPITLSRNPVKTKEDTVEIVKVSILNPSKKDWKRREFLRKEGLCGKVDGICYIDKEDKTGKCDTEANAKVNDPDCRTGLLTGMDCGENSEKSPCLMSSLEDLYCPAFTVSNLEPNCNPKEGVDVYLICDGRLMEKPFKRSIGSIEMGKYKTSILMLRLNKIVPEDQYLCQLKIFAEDNEYMADLIVRVENE